MLHINYKKKNYGQTETGKKMFIRLYEAAKNIGDDEIISFSAQVLDVFEKKMMWMATLSGKSNVK